MLFGSGSGLWASLGRHLTFSVEGLQLLPAATIFLEDRLQLLRLVHGVELPAGSPQDGFVHRLTLEHSAPLEVLDRLPRAGTVGTADACVVPQAGAPHAGAARPDMVHPASTHPHLPVPVLPLGLLYFESRQDIHGLLHHHG